VVELLASTGSMSALARKEMQEEKLEVRFSFILHSCGLTPCRESVVLHRKHPPSAPTPRLLAGRHPSHSSLDSTPGQDNDHRIRSPPNSYHRVTCENSKVPYHLHSSSAAQITTSSATRTEWDWPAPTDAAGRPRWRSNVVSHPARKKQVPQSWIEAGQKRRRVRG
jgi:hypothetical protein